MHVNNLSSDRRPSLLLVDPDPVVTGRCVPALLPTFAVVAMSNRRDAAARLARQGHRFVVTELILPDGDGLELCRMANTSPRPVSVIVITDQPHRVPDALDAGCDAVMLKPFSPNLLVARLGRLLQAESRLNIRANRFDPWAGHTRAERAQRGTTNAFWPEIQCPHCRHDGVTSFDFTSRRRMWCACLQCRHVWLEHRREVWKEPKAT